MASIHPGTCVEFLAGEVLKLRFPPAEAATLAVSVHPDALKVGKKSTHTQLVGLVDKSVVWTGALCEDLLRQLPDVVDNPRSRLASHFLRGDRLWHIVRPGLLTKPGVSRPLCTIYDRDRPWVVVGELRTGTLLAVPLNEPSNPKWYTPVLAAKDLLFRGSKSSQVELAHLWALPEHLPDDGLGLSYGGAARLTLALRQYFHL